MRFHTNRRSSTQGRPPPTRLRSLVRLCLSPSSRQSGLNGSDVVVPNDIQSNFGVPVLSDPVLQFRTLPSSGTTSCSLASGTEVVGCLSGMDELRMQSSICQIIAVGAGDMAHEEREDDLDKESTMFASELKQTSGEKGHVYNGKSLRVTVALDLTTFTHSKGHGSCHSSYLSYQFHSHTSDEATVVIEISRVTSATELLPAAVNKFGSRVASFISDDPCCSDSTIAHQVTMNDAFYNHELTVVYHGECYKQECAVAIHKLDSFDQSSRALSEVTRPCFAFISNGFLIGPIGDDKLFAGHECGKVNSVLMLERMWHAEIASDGNALELDSTVSEGVKLDTARVICSGDGQSTAKLRHSLNCCFQLCHCETKQSIILHTDEFDNMDAMNQPSLSQVFTSLPLILLDVSRVLGSFISGTLKLSRNYLKYEVREESGHPDEWIEIVTRDVNSLFANGLHSERRLYGFKDSTMLATDSSIISLFDFSAMISWQLTLRDITASLKLMKILLLHLVDEMETTDMSSLKTCD